MLPGSIQNFIELDGFRLAYWEKNPTASHTIFFIHGNSGSSRSWIHQFNDDHFKNYRLISIDLPGHGDSSDSTNPADDYSPLITGKILESAISILKGDIPYSFVGFSYGTNLIAEMLNYDLKPEGIAFISSCVAGTGASLDKILIKPDTSIYFHDNISKDAAESFLKERIKSADANTFNRYLEDYSNTRIPFRSSLIQAAIQGKYSDEIKLLKEFNNPILVIFGEDDNLVNINYMDQLPLNYWNNKIYKLKDSGHYVHSEKPQEFNNLLFQYINDRIK